MTRSILVPLDTTAAPSPALGPAHDLAVAFDAPLVLLHACWSDAGQAREDLETLAEKQDGVRTGVLVAHGFAGPAIADAVIDRPGTVVCMSTAGHGGAAGVLLAGVAEEVLRGAPCPVVLVGPECSPLALTASERAATDPPALVLGFDGEEAAEAAVPLAVEWARALHLELHVVAVTHHGGEKVGDQPAAPVRRRVWELVDELRDQGLHARAAFPDDHDPAHGLVACADQQPTALIVTGARRRGGLAHAVLGPVALRVVRHATVPVLVAERRA